MSGAASAGSFTVTDGDFPGGVYEFHYYANGDQLVINEDVTSNPDITLTNNGWNGAGSDPQASCLGGAVRYWQADGPSSAVQTSGALTMGWDFGPTSSQIEKVELRTSHLLFQFNPFNGHAVGDEIFASVATPPTFAAGPHTEIYRFAGTEGNFSTIGLNAVTDITSFVSPAWLNNPQLLELKLEYQQTPNPTIPGRHLQLFRTCNQNTDPTAGFLLRVTLAEVQALDHFLLYSAFTTPGTPRFEQRVVSLADQIESGDFVVRAGFNRFVSLGNPAEIDGEPTSNPETHLVSYRIRAAAGEPAHQRVLGIQVTNQFGEISLDTITPWRLLVPSAKHLSDPVDEPTDPGVDHFKCYLVRTTPGTDGFTPEQVLLSDQFDQPKLFNVLFPVMLCNPVDKNSEGTAKSEDHLLCYFVRRASGAPRHERRQGIHINNQFGPLQLNTLFEMQLCVPSEKEIASP